MKYKTVWGGFVLVAMLLGIVPKAEAQTTIVIGPTSRVDWETPGLGPALAGTCTYQLAQGTGAFSTVVGAVTCVAAVPPSVNTGCSVLATTQPNLTIGSGSITATTTCSGQTSLPSTAFAYVVVLVPVPQNLRIR